MENKLRYIYLCFLNELNFLLQERIIGLYKLIEDINMEEKIKMQNGCENLGIMMSASMYLNKFSDKNKINRYKNKKEYSEIIHNIDILKMNIKMINDCMLYDNNVVFLILYIYISKEKSELINNTFRNRRYQYVSILNKIDLKEEFKKINNNSHNNYDEVVKIFLEYINKYENVFCFLDNNSETIKNLLDEPVKLKVLNEYMSFLKKTFPDFNKKAKKENIYNLSYRKIFFDIGSKLIF